MCYFTIIMEVLCSIFTPFVTYSQILCSVLAGLLHYFFLAVFSWMLCEGVMLYLMVVKVFSQLSKKWWFFLLLGYGKSIRKGTLILLPLTYVLDIGKYICMYIVHR